MSLFYGISNSYTVRIWFLQQSTVVVTNPGLSYGRLITYGKGDRLFPKSEGKSGGPLLDKVRCFNLLQANLVNYKTDFYRIFRSLDFIKHILKFHTEIRGNCKYLKILE